MLILWFLLDTPSRKKLPLYPTINVFNICKILLYLFITLKTTNTSKLFFIQALVDSEATEIFVNQTFVENIIWTFEAYTSLHIMT